MNLRRLLIDMFVPVRAARTMRHRWLEIERAGLETHQANLEALRAWKDGNTPLLEKWTTEMNDRLKKHEQLMNQWVTDFPKDDNCEVVKW